ncbi:ER membrane protein complex subunit 1 isoform X2 [Bombus vosnesenskii]|uniref:ER membrane protein complex subunit 1 n=3 Tax=Pyrobombus TaxID=144703 RepID=A0A6J3KPC4_9HYME|nr:ER membrane protein complex subunit 1 isoform X2 [Bombus impatiens]XP_033195409.1 ER membrane protein complex subunit 1 isoform X2 [Bombus vancouverensis nearcticus]XP_033296954.1 ER membrane protein complex subunit 1 isoform X2 [Bombus bifarius]XP_033353976.1 ER membrane protein complex subunit 1 isoform X2 [Bombus vosnesenskii]
MAPFVWSFRGNINRFLIDVQILQYLIILVGLFNLSLCLYEDQVGKFDWKQNYVGKIKFASFDTVSTAKKIIVATEENVIAALNLKSGQILWRRVLEKGYAGRIRALGGIADGDLVSVSGGVPAIVRAWDLATGHILHEWPIAEQNHDRIKDVKWHIKDGTLHHILPIYNSGVEVTSYDSKTGDKLKTRRVSAPFITQETECVLAAPYLACLKGDSSLAILLLVHLFDTHSQPQSVTINTIFGAGAQGPYHLESVLGEEPVVSISADNNQRKRILLVGEVPVPIQRDIAEDSMLYIVSVDNEKVLLETTYKNGVTEIVASELLTSKPMPNLSIVVTHNSLLSPTIMASVCPRQTKGVTCRHLLASEDHSVALLQHNKLVWAREEALASIVAVEIIELPMSDRDQEIETEFDQKERDVLSMMFRRVSSQLKQARTFFQSILSLTPQQSNQRTDLVRDKFGLHKMIVLVTSTGKLYGIETRKGEIIWQLRVRGIRGFNKRSDAIILYVQRGSRHFPYPPQCALLAEDKQTGEGIVYTFNPITGQPLDGLIKLGYRIKQSMLLHVTTDDFLRGILIFDTRDKAHVYPEGATAIAASLAKNTYIFTADQTTGILSGYSLSYSTAQELISHKVWELLLSPKNQRITHVVSKNPIERVHSQGRVLSDRSVLYKYINPNLVAIVTEGVGRTHKDTLNLYLLDVVSGAMIFSIMHKRVRGPVHVVHSENWIVYSYFNEKSRRTEIASLELYEGKIQSNTTVFSSLATTKLPIVERQAFIFPAAIESMRETITEKGITSKHIIVALANGGVLELPWMMVDPRRPINPEIREEGVIPYMPEIPIHMDAIINYNQSVFRVSGIHTSPSGLESTCLVFVHGLDLFYTRVAPSKTFDVLKEDFDYYLIVIVLAALLISSYITKKLASQKAQKQAWK